MQFIQTLERLKTRYKMAQQSLLIRHQSKTGFSSCYWIIGAVCTVLDITILDYVFFSANDFGYDGSSENRYRQKGSLNFLPSFKIQHTKYTKSVKLAVLRQEKYPALLGFPSQPAQNRPGPVCLAYLVHTAPTLHFFIRYLYIIHLFQNGVTRVLDVDCHSMLYLFYAALSLKREMSGIRTICKKILKQLTSDIVLMEKKIVSQ